MGNLQISKKYSDVENAISLPVPVEDCFIEECNKQENEVNEVVDPALEKLYWTEKWRSVNESYPATYDLDMSGYELLHNKVMCELIDVYMDNAPEENKKYPECLKRNTDSTNKCAKQMKDSSDDKSTAEVKLNNH